MITSATLIFFQKINNQNHYLYERQITTQIYQSSSYSFILSLAEQIVYHFKNVSIPTKKPLTCQDNNIIFKYNLKPPHPVYRSLNNFQNWLYHLCYQLQRGNAYNYKGQVYIGIQINKQYGQFLKIKKTIKPLSFNIVTYVSQIKQKSLKKKNKNVLLLICKPDATIDKQPKIPLIALFQGIYFQNQKWKVFQIGIGQIPSDQQLLTADLIIIPGSKANISLDRKKYDWISKIENKLKFAYENNKKLKIIGFCFGHQLIATTFGGQVIRLSSFNYGNAQLFMNKQYFQQKFKQYNCQNKNKLLINKFHGDMVSKIPKNFIEVAKSYELRNQIMISKDERIFSIQGHPQYSTGFIRNLQLHFNQNQLKNYSQQQLKKLWEIQKIPNIQCSKPYHYYILKFKSQ